MTKLIDPIKLLIEMASRETPTTELATSLESEVPFEIPMTPPPGAHVLRLTVGSTYRVPIPVLFDPSTRTTFPMPNNK